jgi:hypothetical protein
VATSFGVIGFGAVRGGTTAVRGVALAEGWDGAIGARCGVRAAGAVAAAGFSLFAGAGGTGTATLRAGDFAFGFSVGAGAGRAAGATVALTFAAGFLAVAGRAGALTTLADFDDFSALARAF